MLEHSGRNANTGRRNFPEWGKNGDPERWTARIGFMTVSGKASPSPSAAPRGAIVVGAAGAIGSALIAELRALGRHDWIEGRSRRDGLDITDEAQVKAFAEHVASQPGHPDLILIASGMLHEAGHMPEKSWRDLDPAFLARSFAVNAIGPALVLKHLLPLLPRHGRAVIAALSARVGSIGDNRLGGWHSYRASKAALNQIVRCMSIECARRNPEAILVAIHPGTVESRLSAPFSKKGLDPVAPATAAAAILAMLERLQASDSGGFFDRTGTPIPW
ncbi:MAG: SDR family NAD(P)-dependent oxidoreductase [Rhodothalassiaceae bacterium]